MGLGGCDQTVAMAPHCQLGWPAKLARPGWRLARLGHPGRTSSPARQGSSAGMPGQIGSAKAKGSEIKILKYQNHRSYKAMTICFTANSKAAKAAKKAKQSKHTEHSGALEGAALDGAGGDVCAA